MNPSFRVWWLIVVACFALHLSVLYTVVVLVVYAFIEQVDRARKFHRRTKDLEEVFGGWEQCKDDPDTEEKGELTRLRLVGQSQLIVARLMQILVRME
jgi:hypothetical protein